eukprot:1156183-Pelagomonas_calceolata.AAC.18
MPAWHGAEVCCSVAYAPRALLLHCVLPGWCIHTCALRETRAPGAFKSSWSTHAPRLVHMHMLWEEKRALGGSKSSWSTHAAPHAPTLVQACAEQAGTEIIPVNQACWHTSYLL